MSGIINNAAKPSQTSGLGNPLLAQTEAKIEGEITDPQMRNDYQRIVVAGLHIGLAGGPNSFAAKLRTSRDPIGDAARSTAALVLIMRRDAKGVFPMKAGIVAGMTLLLHALDFIDRAGIGRIAEPELEQATRIFANELLHRQGITPQRLQQITGKVNGIIADPQALAALNLKAGVTRHPQAATPTPLPGGPPAAR